MAALKIGYAVVISALLFAGVNCRAGREVFLEILKNDRTKLDSGLARFGFQQLSQDMKWSPLGLQSIADGIFARLNDDGPKGRFLERLRKNGKICGERYRLIEGFTGRRSIPRLCGTSTLSSKNRLNVLPRIGKLDGAFVSLRSLQSWEEMRQARGFERFQGGKTNDAEVMKLNIRSGGKERRVWQGLPLGRNNLNGNNGLSLSEPSSGSKFRHSSKIENAIKGLSLGEPASGSKFRHSSKIENAIKGLSLGEAAGGSKFRHSGKIENAIKGLSLGEPASGSKSRNSGKTENTIKLRSNVNLGSGNKIISIGKLASRSKPLSSDKLTSSEKLKSWITGARSDKLELGEKLGNTSQLSSLIQRHKQRLSSGDPGLISLKNFLGTDSKNEGAFKLKPLESSLTDRLRLNEEARKEKKVTRGERQTESQWIAKKEVVNEEGSSKKRGNKNLRANRSEKKPFKVDEWVSLIGEEGIGTSDLIPTNIVQRLSEGSAVANTLKLAFEGLSHGEAAV